jgi:hypothetical protein
MLARLAVPIIVAALIVAAGESVSASYGGYGSAQFWGMACLHTECGGEAIGQTVIAKVGNVECGEDITVHPISDGEPFSGYAMDVLTDAEKPDCARPGDTIQLFIGGEPANPTATWEEGSHHLDIHTGPAFATFSGWLTCEGEPCIEFVVGPNTAPRVRAYVDAQLCASHAVSGWLITSYYSVNIPSDEGQPGCGTEGAIVSFTVDGVPANEIGTWTVGQTTLPLSTGELVWGDIDCSGTTDPVDALGLLRYDAGLAVNMPYGCREIGTLVSVDQEHIPWGNFDCMDDIDPVDALKTLMADAGLEYEAGAACPSEP